MSKTEKKYGRNGWTSLTHSDKHKVNLSGNGHKVRAEVSEDWMELYVTNTSLDPEDGQRVQVVLRYLHDPVSFIGYGRTQIIARKAARDKAEEAGYAPSPPSGGHLAYL